MKRFLAVATVCLFCASANAAKLVEVRTIDDEHIMIYLMDGEVECLDTGKGPTAFKGLDSAGEVIHDYAPHLQTAEAVKPDSYKVASKDDKNYATAAAPTAVFRRAKVNGTDRGWPEAKFTIEHTIFLKLPKKLTQGGKYTLTMADDLGLDKKTADFTFDIYNSVSEAVHVNIIGYNPDQPIKAADLYMWLGDGGARDYSEYVGKKVFLYNVTTKEKKEVGAVSFWKKAGGDFGGRDATKSDVWNCDFSAANTTGTCRLVVDGVGCSPDFVMNKSAYYEPFKTSVRGFYYMRIGEPKDIKPVPRQPQYIPGKDPADFKVYITTYGPFHPDWKKKGGDQWDNRDWSAYKEPGEPTNPNAWGGHSDATDWDRNLGHISIIWDLLLPYILSNGKIGDDNCQIRESGDGIPDIIQEAQYEVDFWLRVRDTKGGYSCGLNNPSDKNGKENTMYQAAASPYMAWASAANCAMLADCFRIAGKKDLMAKYRDEAVKAWQFAKEEGLDLSFGIGNGQTRGRDLKALAAAYLYNVTGDKMYEEVLAKETMVTGPTAELDNPGKGCQYWPTAGYLMCAKYKVQPIHNAKLLDDMKAAVINEAMKKNVANSTKWPSRRSSNNAYGWFQTIQEVQAACIAHAVSTTPAEKDALLKALILEADWGLGRNPMNMVQMSGLGSRCPQQMFTTGRNDGVPGIHPGHTPYMNADPWSGGYMFDPQWYAKKGYPDWSKWPHAEAFWNAPYCFANNEFTPQQSMRGKMALLGYLYSLGDTYKASK